MTLYTFRDSDTIQGFLTRTIDDTFAVNQIYPAVAEKLANQTLDEAGIQNTWRTTLVDVLRDAMILSAEALAGWWLLEADLLSALQDSAVVSY